MLLDNTTRKIQVKLGEAITTSNCDVVAAFVDMTATGYTPGSSNTVTNGVTAVDATAVPGSGTQRQVNALFVYNADTVTHNIIVIYNDNATLRTLIKAAVLAGQTLQWDKENGWSVVPTTASATLPTRQTLTALGTATYTTPVGARQLRIRMVGSGGGAGGGGLSGSAGNGGVGGNTTFNAIVANGGAATTTTGIIPGAGGTGGAGAATFRTPGQAGEQCAAGNGTNGSPSLPGATSLLGGGAGPNGSNAGIAAGANTGAGGSSGGCTVGTLGSFAGASGSSGEYVEYIINSPAATYSYTITAGGTAGTAGTSGNAGGAGGSGVIIVDEIY